MMMMCSSSSVLLVSLCLLLCLPPYLSSGVAAKPGENVTLPCRRPVGAEITLLKWTKPGLERYILFYRENRLYEKYQHPSYRGRVELKDPEMKNGDVSVVLKNVNTNDTGRYECYIKQGGGSDLKLIKAVNLEVTDSGDTEERGGDKEGGDKGLHIGLGVGLTAAALLVGGVVAFIAYKKHRKPTEQSSSQAHYKAADDIVITP